MICYVLFNILNYHFFFKSAINRTANENSSSIGGSASAGYDNPTFRRGFSFTSSVPFSYLTGGNPGTRFEIVTS